MVDVWANFVKIHEEYFQGLPVRNIARAPQSARPVAAMAFISRESGVSEDSSIHPSFMTATDEDPFAAAETTAAIDAKRNLLDDLNR